jgi:F0F1-type ATP synthase epsilon subunit
MADTSNTKYDLKIVGREGIVFEGKVDSISSYNERGKFDVLAMHANFISLIYKKLIIRVSPNDIREMDIGNALLRNKEGILEIYLGIEEFAEEQKGIQAA